MADIGLKTASSKRTGGLVVCAGNHGNHYNYKPQANRVYPFTRLIGDMVALLPMSTLRPRSRNHDLTGAYQYRGLTNADIQQKIDIRIIELVKNVYRTGAANLVA